MTINYDSSPVIAEGSDSGLWNAFHKSRESLAGLPRLFEVVKEYFWSNPPPGFMHESHSLANHDIDVENAKDLDPTQGSRYSLTIKCIVLAAATAGITTVGYLMHSALYGHGDRNVIEPGTVSPEAFSAALATTVLIGRRLLSEPSTVSVIANQSVFANAPFNLKLDFSQIFNYKGIITDFHCSQTNGSPLPEWLTIAPVPTNLVGSISMPSGSRNSGSIIVVGNYTYLPCSSGLFIIDISNKTLPVLVGSLVGLSNPTDVAVVGNYAYLADNGNNGALRIVDVSNKASPTLVGSTSGVNPLQVAATDNYAYVINFTPQALSIFDVVNKTHPTLIGNIANRSPNALTVVDNYAYVEALLDGKDVLRIIDISNPINPTFAGSTAPLVLGMFGVAVVGDYAYVADAGDYPGLKIIDISNKASPTLVGKVAIQDQVNSLTVLGNYAYVVGSTKGLTVIDISSKTNPTVIGGIEIAGLPQGIKIVGNYAYVVDNYAGLRIFSASKIALSGVPAPIYRGVLPIQITITDTFGETSSIYFSITVLNNPPIAPTVQPQTVHRTFDWTLPEFSDKDGDAITYSAILADGSSLPGWVSFNSTTRKLSGVVPPVVTVRKINITANDAHGGIANATQDINVVNAAPVIGSSALPGQSVNPGVPFSFLLDSDVFTDPDKDPLIYSATLANQKPLPDWLTFNQTGEIFAGTAPVGSAGQMSVVVTATDPFGATAARSFDLNVVGPNNNLPRKLKNPPDYLVGISKGISFQISNDTFFVPDNDQIIWSAFMTGGNALPIWLHFDAGTQFFYGTAPDSPQELPIDVQAEDWQHVPAIANFNLFVEGPPQLVAPLSNLAANVGAKFKFIVPENTFQNLGIQGGLNYSAALTTGAALPAWLNFDPATITFSGTPSRKDTDAFSSRPLPIRLMAKNNIGAASVDFILNVQGESNATLAIKIISSVGATLAIMGAAYAKRNSVWKMCMKCIYQLPTEHVIIGQEKEYCHTITHLSPENVASVKLLRNGKSLPGGILRPDWLIYDNSSGKLTIDATTLKEQDGLTISRWTVQVKNKGGCVNHLVWEEFDIKFSIEDQLQEMASLAATGSISDRLKQLKQPLINPSATAS